MTVKQMHSQTKLKVAYFLITGAKLSCEQRDDLQNSQNDKRHQTLLSHALLPSIRNPDLFWIKQILMLVLKRQVNSGFVVFGLYFY